MNVMILNSMILFPNPNLSLVWSHIGFVESISTIILKKLLHRIPWKLLNCNKVTRPTASTKLEVRHSGGGTEIFTL